MTQTDEIAQAEPTEEVQPRPVEETPAKAVARRHALITGASSGIGEEFARQLAKKGYDLVLVARRKDRLEKLADELSQGTTTEIIEADLTAPEGMISVERRLGQGDIDLLVNNAGFGTRGEFANMPLYRELEELDLNIKALVRLTHVALGKMIERKRGNIINVGSTGSFQPVPYMSLYAATKAFVLHFSEGVHEEAKKHGVTVTCLCPGYVMTEFQQVAGIDRRRIPNRGILSPEQVVADALRGAAAGRAIVIPGAMNRTLATGIVRIAPRFAVRRIAGAIFKDAGTP
jgi:short-subunit dehydrogenase